jgi:hypothetical protein
VGLLDTILKGTHPGTIYLAPFGQAINEIIKFTLSLTFDSNEIPEREPKNNNHFFYIKSDLMQIFPLHFIEKFLSSNRFAVTHAISKI